MYKIILQRHTEYENVKKPNKDKIEGATIGHYSVLDESGNALFACVCVENAGPSTDTPNQDKRIMPRTYKLKWSKTSVKLPDECKGIGLLLYTDELPSFEGRRIFIHIGNCPQDTEACLLLNYVDNHNGTASQSTNAVRDFYRLVRKEGVENFTLEVREIA